jgi:hypothetical protein
MMNNLLGQHFGLLSVVDRSEPKKSRSMWLCHCKCGSERPFREDHLLAGRTKSCGCATSAFKKARMEKKHSLVNKRFGSLFVVWRTESKKVGVSSHSRWVCKCDCGELCEAKGSDLTSGERTSCGWCKSVLKLEAHA